LEQGQQEEFGLRELFDEPIVPQTDSTASLDSSTPTKSYSAESSANQDISVAIEEQHTLDTITGQLSLEPEAQLQPASFLLFYRSNCPNCPPVKAFMERVSVQGRQVNVDTAEGIAEAAAYSILAAPTVLFFDKAGNETTRVFAAQELRELFPEADKK
jgi:ribonucleoside-triphosphate reductase